MAQITETIEVYKNGVLVETKQITYDGPTAIEAEYEKYVMRKNEGVAMFLELAASLRLAKVSGALDEATFDAIEDLLVPVRNEIVLGQWKTGLRKLELLGSAAIGQAMYDDIHGKINTYILNNY